MILVKESRSVDMKHMIITLLLLCVNNVAAWIPGSATFYGNSAAPYYDSYRLEDGTCACHKAKASGVCYNGLCFEKIADPKMVAAVNTPRLENTRLCGKCVEIRCSIGKYRGLPLSEFDWRNPCNAIPRKKSITVTVTDSCPESHANPSNAKYCRYDTKNMHFDLSFWAFQKLADPLFGVIDIDFRFVPCQESIIRKTGTIWKTCCADSTHCVYGSF